MAETNSLLQQAILERERRRTSVEPAKPLVQAAIEERTRRDATQATKGQSTGLMTGPLSLLAVPGQLLGKVVSKAILKPAQENIESNAESLRGIAKQFLDRADAETDPQRKKDLIQQSIQASQRARQSGAMVEDLLNEAKKRERIETPIGTIPAISDKPVEATRQVAGRGVTTAGFTGGAIAGAAGAGALYGAGSAIEEGKSVLPESLKPGDIYDSVVGRAVTYAAAGKLLGYGLEKVAGTGFGQKVLSSKPVRAVGAVLNPLMAKEAPRGTAGAVVDDAFKIFGKFSDKVVSPSTYLRPVGKVTGILKTPEQKMENAVGKIEKYWNDTKQRYQAAVRYDKNSPRILAEEGIIPDGRAGAMITADQEKLVLAKANGEHVTLNRMLDASGEYAPLSSLNKNVQQRINNAFMGTDRQEALRWWGREYGQLLKDFNSQIITNAAGEKLIPVRQLNDVKSYMWSNGYPSTLAPRSEQVAARTSRIAGNVMKTGIEDAIAPMDEGAKKAIIDLNNRLGDLYEAARFLRAMNGKKLPFGLIGRHFARATGAIIGSEGGVVGSATGAITADKIVDVFQNPKYSVGAASAFIKNAQKVNPQAVEEADRIIRKALQEQAARLRLQGPTPVGAPSNPIITPPPTTFEKGVPQTVTPPPPATPLTPTAPKGSKIMSTSELKYPALKGTEGPAANLDKFVQDAVKEGIISPSEARGADMGLVDYIRKNGVNSVPPIKVTKDGVIVDGVHRLDAFRELGIEKVPVEVVKAPAVKGFAAKKTISTGPKEGIDYGIYWDAKKKVWYAAQVGTGERFGFVNKEKSMVENWIKVNAKYVKAGIFKPKK